MVSNLLSKALSMVRFYMLKDKNISHSKELFLSLLKKIKSYHQNFIMIIKAVNILKKSLKQKNIT